MPISGSAPNKVYSRQVNVYTGDDAWQQLDAAGRAILADDMDDQGNDLKVALNTMLMKDGGNQPSADLPMNSQKHTGVGNATARTNYAAAGQVADSSLTYAGTSSGTDTITASVSPAITAYAAGQRFHFKAGGTNTGAATININSVGAKSVKKGAAGGTDLAAGDITTGGMYTVEYDGTNFQLIPRSVNSPDAATVTTSLTVNGAASGAGKIVLGEDTDNGSHAVTVQAAASMAASLTLTLPSADGTAGQGLQTNGSGALSFGNICPIGSMVAWPTSSAPTGWLECDGSAVSRTTYATLFALIGDDYGAGDGSTTFNLPDLRGEFIRGWDHGKGSDPNAGTRTNRGDGTTGDNVGTKQADEFELHGHPARFSYADSSQLDTTGGITVNGGANTNVAAFTGTPTASQGQQIGGSGGSETRPRNVNMMYIIRAL